MHRPTHSRSDPAVRSLSYSSYTSSSPNHHDNDVSEEAPFLSLGSSSSTAFSQSSSSWTFLLPRRPRYVIVLAIVTLTTIFLYLRAGPPPPTERMNQHFESPVLRTPPPPSPLVQVLPPTTITVTAPGVTETVTIQRSSRTLEPVVFSLIMWSESSAIEGALLIKVRSLLSYASPYSRSYAVCHHVHHKATRVSYHL